MKRLLFVISLFVSISCFSQTVETVINVPYTSSSTPTRQALLYLPNDYGSTGSLKYTLLVWNAGAGEAADGQSAGTGVAKIYNQASNGGPPYYIEHGTGATAWPASGWVNPRTGVTEKMIIVSPQAADWGNNGTELDFIIQYLVANYRVDTNRIAVSGFSAGGMGTVEYASQLNVNEDPPTQGANQRRWKPSCIVPISNATNQPIQSWGTITVADSIRAYGFGDPVHDLYGGFCSDYLGFINTASSGFGFFHTYTSGHGPVNPFWVPTFSENFTFQGLNATYSIYSWILAQSRSSTPSTNPTANAGPNQSITLPTSSVTMAGSATAGSGHSVTSTVWSQTGGPITATITTNTSLTTTITGMSTAGTYTFLLTVTQSGGATATASMTLTVSSNSPVANAGPDQTIALPVNSVTLDGTNSTGAISSYLWTYQSGPTNPTINNSGTATATAIGLVAGSYVFKLSVNSGASTDVMNVVVLPVQPCGPKTKYVITPASDSSYFHDNSDHLYQPGDTIVFGSNHVWSNTELDNFTGNPSCPLIITNGTGQTLFIDHIGSQETNGMKLFSCTYVTAQGIGDNSVQYGFKMQRDTNLRRQGAAAFSIEGRSAHIRVKNVNAHNVDIGFNIKEDGGCDSTLNYPSWIMDSIEVDHCWVNGTWNEGMYIGNTSPDNLPSDPRPVTCNIPPNPDSVIFPDPIKNGQMLIHDNIVDSTGRGGIQISNSISVNGRISQVYNNTIMHSGLNGDDAQGSNLTLGIYTQGHFFGNTMISALTWAIASVGACGDSLIYVENNTTDSSGFQHNIPGNATAPDTATYNPATATYVPDPFTYPYTTWFDTRPRLYTNSSPVKGTAIPGHDSTGFVIRNNIYGLWRSFTSGTDNHSTIQIEDHYNGMIRKNPSGDIICGNTSSYAQPITVFTGNAGTTINYSTNCNVVIPPCNCITVPSGFIIKFK